ncbi:MAG: DUF3617 family protein [Gammaproteobacteria bacterium]
MMAKRGAVRDEAHRRWQPIVLMTVLWSSCAAALPPGLYELSAQTVMPHLEAMRRFTAVETRCLSADPSTLFPVLRQPALRGCTLQPAAGAPGGSFDLRCRTEMVATGTAVITTAPQHIRGDLSIKMGGKNMTFSQHVRARPLGACPDDD